MSRARTLAPDAPRVDRRARGPRAPSLRRADVVEAVVDGRRQLRALDVVVEVHPRAVALGREELPHLGALTFVAELEPAAADPRRDGRVALRIRDGCVGVERTGDHRGVLR